MKFMDQPGVDAEIFDSPQYWLSHELKALDEEYVLFDQDEKTQVPALKKIKRSLNRRLKSKEELNEPFNLDSDLAAIEAVLKAQYGLELSLESSSKEKIAEINKLMLFSPYPYLRFLLQKRFYLNQRKTLQVSLAGGAGDQEMNPERQETSALFDIGKKILGIFDNTVTGVQNIFVVNILQSLDAILTGTFGFVVHLGEGVQSARDAYLAYSNEKLRQRKTRILTGVLSFMAAGAGTGISLALLAGSLGAAVSASTLALAPILIPGLLVAIYGLVLWRNFYVLSQLQEDEALLRKSYEDCAFMRNNLRYEVHALEKKIEAMKIERILIQQSQRQKLSPEDQATYVSYKQLLITLLNKQTEFAQVEGAWDLECQKLRQCEEAIFQAKRAVVFSTLEVVSSAMVLVAMVLAASAVIGASIASFGGVPLAMLVVGVVVGVVSQLADHYDTRNGFSYTQRLGNWVSQQWKRLTGNETERAALQVNNKRDPKYVSAVYERLIEENPSHAVASGPNKKPAVSRKERSTSLRSSSLLKEKKPAEVASLQESHDSAKQDFLPSRHIK